MSAREFVCVARLIGSVPNTVSRFAVGEIELYELDPAVVRLPSRRGVEKALGRAYPYPTGAAGGSGLDSVLRGDRRRRFADWVGTQATGQRRRQIPRPGIG
jgi:hypothetical protein